MINIVFKCVKKKIILCWDFSLISIFSIYLYAERHFNIEAALLFGWDFQQNLTTGSMDGGFREKERTKP